MRDKTYAYVVKINWHYNELIKTLNSLKAVNDLDFMSIEGKAILFDLFQIGELFAKFPGSFAAQLNQKDVKGIIDTRNVVVHGYGNIKREEIINSIENNLPSLINEMNRLAKRNYIEYLLKLANQEVDIYIDTRIDESNVFNFGYIDNIVNNKGVFQRIYVLDIDYPIPRCVAYVVGLLIDKSKDVAILLSAAVPSLLADQEIIEIVRKKNVFRNFSIYPLRNQDDIKKAIDDLIKN